MSHFVYFETDAEGNPKSTPIEIEYRHVRSVLALHYPGPMFQLLHCIDLACAAPGHPVDVVHWTGEESARRLSYSGRLVYHKTETNRVIFA